MAEQNSRRATLAARRATLAAGMAGITEGDDFEYEDDEEAEDFWANININKMSRVELKIALEARGLSIKGSKKELRARLEQSVQEEKEEELEYMAMVEAARRAEAALEESGSLYTIGLNRRGQLGLGDKEDRSEFTVVKQLRGKGICEVCTTGDTVLARGEDGNVFGWGGGGDGPIGMPMPTKVDGVAEEKFISPQLIESLQGEGVIRIGCGPNHAGALSDGGDCYMWGDGTRGQLGTGKFTFEEMPTLVEALQSGTIVSQIAIGQTHTLVVTSKQELYSWGFANSGKLGLGVTERKGVPPPRNRYFPNPCIVSKLQVKVVHQIACSANHCAAVTDCGLYTWGSGDGGRLGHGDHDDRKEPTLVESLAGSVVIDIALGFWHSAAVVQVPPTEHGGWLFTWGSGYHGQLAQGDISRSPIPAFSQTCLDMHLHLLKIATGPTHSYALTVDGALYSWGSCSHGELGRGEFEDYEHFTPIPGFVDCFNTMVNRIGRGAVASFACGNQFTVVATSKYTGPSEEELKQMEEDEAEREAAESQARAEEERRNRREKRKQMAEEKRRELHEMNTSKPRCELCDCPGFEQNVFRPQTCKECNHSRAKHTILNKEEEEEVDAETLRKQALKK